MQLGGINIFGGRAARDAKLASPLDIVVGGLRLADVPASDVVTFRLDPATQGKLSFADRIRAAAPTGGVDWLPDGFAGRLAALLDGVESAAVADGRLGQVSLTRTDAAYAVRFADTVRDWWVDGTSAERRELSGTIHNAARASREALERGAYWRGSMMFPRAASASLVDALSGVRTLSTSQADAVAAVIHEGRHGVSPVDAGIRVAADGWVDEGLAVLFAERGLPAAAARIGVELPVEFRPHRTAEYDRATKIMETVGQRAGFDLDTPAGLAGYDAALRASTEAGGLPAMWRDMAERIVRHDPLAVQDAERATRILAALTNAPPDLGRLDRLRQGGS